MPSVTIDSTITKPMPRGFPIGPCVPLGVVGTGACSVTGFDCGAGVCNPAVLGSSVSLNGPPSPSEPHDPALICRDRHGLTGRILTHSSNASRLPIKATFSNERDHDATTALGLPARDVRDRGGHALAGLSEWAVLGSNQ